MVASQPEIMVKDGLHSAKMAELEKRLKFGRKHFLEC
jgi:hypothetical protein